LFRIEFSDEGGSPYSEDIENIDELIGFINDPNIYKSTKKYNL
jgi:hypothetical protein